MKQPWRMRRIVVPSLAAVLSLVAAESAAARESQSTSLAKDLGRLLAEQRLEAIVVPDRRAPDRFVAALFIPGVQLLVVAARYPAPDYLALRTLRPESGPDVS